MWSRIRHTISLVSRCRASSGNACHSGICTVSAAGLKNRSNWCVVGWRGMDISPIRVVRAQCCAHSPPLRGSARVLQKRRQGAKHRKIDPRASCDAPAGADYPVEHPGRNLQPTVRHTPGEAAAEDCRVTLLDHFVDMDLPTSPGMKRIKKLALNTGLVGVLSSSCTTQSDPTARLATSRHLSQAPRKFRPGAIQRRGALHPRNKLTSNRGHFRGAGHFNSRVRRTIAGVFHHISPQHADLYFHEIGFSWSQRVITGNAVRKTRHGAGKSCVPSGRGYRRRCNC